MVTFLAPDGKIGLQHLVTLEMIKVWDILMKLVKVGWSKFEPHKLQLLLLEKFKKENFEIFWWSKFWPNMDKKSCLTNDECSLYPSFYSIYLSFRLSIILTVSFYLPFFLSFANWSTNILNLFLSTILSLFFPSIHYSIYLSFYPPFPFSILLSPFISFFLQSRHFRQIFSTTTIRRRESVLINLLRHAINSRPSWVYYKKHINGCSNLANVFPCSSMLSTTVPRTLYLGHCT